MISSHLAKYCHSLTNHGRVIFHTCYPHDMYISPYELCHEHACTKGFFSIIYAKFGLLNDGWVKKRAVYIQIFFKTIVSETRTNFSMLFIVRLSMLSILVTFHSAAVKKILPPLITAGVVFRRTIISLFVYHPLQNKSWHQSNGWKAFIPVLRAVQVLVMMSNLYHFLFYCQCTSKQMDGYNINWFWTYDTCTCDTILSCILVLVWNKS